MIWLYLPQFSYLLFLSSSQKIIAKAKNLFPFGQLPDSSFSYPIKGILTFCNTQPLDIFELNTLGL